MKTLLILRHAKSSWANPRLSDHDRPLKRRGKRDAPRMGRLLLDQNIIPGLIITSSAVRALATAEMVALACDYQGELMVTRAFYHADSDTYIEYLRMFDEEPDPIMVVGHNPGMEELLEELTGAIEHMPTAALAEVTLPIDGWDELTTTVEGKLVSLWYPRGLKT